MGKVEIVEKLHNLLRSYLPFTEECQVVYLLVEVRKMLDRDNNKKYPLLRFYSDWSVHTEKDRITPEMKLIMTNIYNDIHDQIINKAHPAKQRTIIDFLYMEDLQAEMKLFFGEYNLSNTNLFDMQNWISLVTLLVRVLADQPINKPCKDIRQFSFHPAAPGRVQGEVIFTNKIDKYDNCTFGNVY